MSLFEEADGRRYTAFVTNTRVGALQWLEARHRAHARVEDRIRCAKDTGLAAGWRMFVADRTHGDDVVLAVGSVNADFEMRVAQ